MTDAGRLTGLLRRIGVDRAVGYTLLGRGWQLVAGPVTLFFIALTFSPEVQGFYYTFSSMLALQVFFELGSAQVILQFASHEKARLTWSEHGTLEGASEAKARLRSLARLAVRFYGLMAAVFVAVLLPAGLVFFSHQSGHEAIAWQVPWGLVVLATGGLMFLSPVFALLEGCGHVRQVAKYRLFQGLAVNAIAWTALALRADLYVASANFMSTLLLAGGWLWWRYRPLLGDLLATAPEETARIDWWREIWPFQWRIALSWLSGYFSFYLFNPLLFAFAGARVAGQMGMSLAIAGVISAAAFAWVNTKVPRFGALIAQRDFRALDRLFFPSLATAVAVFLTGALLFAAGDVLLHHWRHPLAERLLPPLPLALLLGAMAVNVVTFSLGAYMRAHKEEPLLAVSLLGGAGIALTAYIGVQAGGATGMLLGYFLTNVVVGLGGVSWIFFRKRQQWHKEDPHGPDNRDSDLQPQRDAARQPRTAPAATDP